MTVLKREAIRMMEQMPEEQVPYIIQYIHALSDGNMSGADASDNRKAETDKMRAFLELEEMLVPVLPELDYEKELAEARDKKYGNID